MSGIGVARADAVAALGAFLRDAKTLSADFTQQVVAGDGKPGKVVSGQFDLSRPNRFRFEYRKPYEQTIVADGSKLWLYDKDLAQVTERNYAEALAASPAAILAGSADATRYYTLKSLPDRDGLQWVDAVPKAKDSLFSSVRIAFRGGELAEMELRDNFGQTSRLIFTRVRRNAPLPASLWQFTPPPGVDVLKQ
ncbi:MAG: outer membrane lipoprotein chaperone LolA [Betaproteobacteria bacterium]|nr:outer membrane lipoprotein chaperone LolA [Betaproteobacteria bacterium]